MMILFHMQFISGLPIKQQSTISDRADPFSIRIVEVFEMLLEVTFSTGAGMNVEFGAEGAWKLVSLSRRRGRTEWRIKILIQVDRECAQG